MFGLWKGFEFATHHSFQRAGFASPHSCYCLRFAIHLRLHPAQSCARTHDKTSPDRCRNCLVAPHRLAAQAPENFNIEASNYAQESEGSNWML